ncbi:MAG TPA: TetR/AcrR family transcriptional regulator [Acidimicrobiales bacterium]
MILGAAIRIAERDGLDGLTFQALGKELGAHATAMYRHFRDKDELLLEMIDELRERSYGDVLTSTGSWQDDLRLQAHSIREHYLRYAAFAQQMAPRSTHRSMEIANTEFALSALARAGLDDEESILYLRLLGNYMRAMSSLEAGVQCLDLGLRSKDRVEWQVAAEGLDPATHPILRRLGARMLAYDDPRIFDLGLELMIAEIDRIGSARA